MLTTTRNLISPTNVKLKKISLDLNRQRLTAVRIMTASGPHCVAIYLRFHP